VTRALGLLAALVSLALPAHAADYEIELVARSPLDGTVVAVAIGDSGVVAYAVKPQAEPVVVHRGTPGDVEPVAEDPFGFEAATLAVGDTGFAGYAGWTEAFHVGFYRADGGAPVLVHEHDDLLVSNARMNGAGHWAFVDLGDQASDPAYLRFWNGALSDPLHEYEDGLVAPLAVNDAGAIAYGFAPDATSQAIAFATPAGPDVLLDSADGYDSLAVLGLSDAGRVLVQGAPDDDPGGNLFLYRLPPDPELIVGTTGGWQIVRPLGIADDGRVAFYGVRTNPDLRGIFVGPDPVADAVLVEGDVVAGATILQIVAPPSNTSRMGGVNAAGAIAFAAEWFDPSLPAGQRFQYAVLRATPVPEPIPGAAGAAALLALSLRAARRRQPTSRVASRRRAARVRAPQALATN
jgi:hypothetical protein